MAGKERVLMVENSDVAVVDFLDRGLLVRLTVENGKLIVDATALHGENLSTFSAYFKEFFLPEYVKAEEPDYSEEEEEEAV